MANYFVATTGNDSNTGLSTAQACLTIAHTSTLLAQGDICNVLDGTYTHAPFTTNAAGVAGNPITYKAANKWQAKLVGTGQQDAICWTNNGAYVTIDGFDISTSGSHGFYNTATNNTVQNCYVHDVYTGVTNPSSNGGAGLDSTGANWTVHHNLVVRIDPTNISGTSNVHGIYIASTNALVYNNIVGKIAAYGIQQWHGASTSEIINNTVFNCYGGILIGSGDSGQLLNGSQNNLVYNNISANNVQFGIRELGLTSLNTYANNLLYNNPTQIDATSTGTTQTGTVTGNPLFVNYVSNGTGDYHITSTSPAIDAGTVLDTVSSDFDYVARPQGTWYDIGAYEAIPPGTGATTAVPSVPLHKGFRRFRRDR